MIKTTFLIFSKNRSLQLKSLLLSIRSYLGVPEDAIYVLYRCEPQIDYDKLFKQFDCNFVPETSFLENVSEIVSKVKTPYFGFMVDDLIFRDPIKDFQWEKILDQQLDIDSFSLRLGRNITHGGEQPNFEALDENIIAWSTNADLGRYWNYFWDLSSSIYRRKHVLTYLNRCRPDKENFPNPFESHYYSCMPNTANTGLVKWVNNLRFPFSSKKQRVACFTESKCFTLGLNVVADIEHNREEIHSPIELHEKMLEGYALEFQDHGNKLPENPNSGGKFFALVKEDALSKPFQN